MNFYLIFTIYFLMEHRTILMEHRTILMEHRTILLTLENLS